MNKAVKMAVVAGSALLLVSTQAMAVEYTVQEVLNNFTLGPVLKTSSVNVATDALLNDAKWSIDSSGGAASQFITEISGWAGQNSVGIYQKSTLIPLYAGSATDGEQTAIFLLGDGTVKIVDLTTATVTVYPQAFTGNKFGFYLKNGAGETFYSDTGANSDNYDHMWAFRGKNDTIKLPSSAPGTWTPDEYVFAWEDSAGGGDNDHNDLIFMVESVSPLPDGGSTLMLLGSVLSSLGLTLRRFRK